MFLAVLLFKDPIYSVLRPSPRVEQFPIYCIAEGYTTKGGPVLAEIYIVNRRGQAFTRDELVRFLKANAFSGGEKNIDPVQMDPSIRIHWQREQGEILTVAEDSEFNAEKGHLDIHPPDRANRDWIIGIREISSKAVLRLLVTTNYGRGREIGRNAKTSLPFEIVYRGE